MKQYFRLIFSFKNILKNQVFKIFNKFILDLLQMSIKNKLFFKFNFFKNINVLWKTIFKIIKLCIKLH